MGWIWAAAARTGRGLAAGATGPAQRLGCAGVRGDVEGAQLEYAFAAGTREQPNAPPPANVAPWLGH